MEQTKTFTIVTTISMWLSLTVAILGVIGILLTGIYPGIFVLMALAIIPIVSRLYGGKLISRSYRSIFTVINLLVILVVLWMTFVIVHDRILKDCC
jgi:hypothetical protein